MTPRPSLGSRRYDQRHIQYVTETQSPISTYALSPSHPLAAYYPTRSFHIMSRHDNMNLELLIKYQALVAVW